MDTKRLCVDLKTKKEELLAEKELLKPKEKIYSTDQLIRAYRHDVLRLYMYDLNSIEYVWLHMKHYIRPKNMADDMSLK